MVRFRWEFGFRLKDRDLRVSGASRVYRSRVWRMRLFRKGSGCIQLEIIGVGFCGDPNGMD